MSGSASSVLRGGLRLSSSRAVVLVLQGSQYFILAKLLGPADFGQVSLFSLIALLVSLTSFGIDAVAAREIPGRLVLNDAERVETLKNLAFTAELSLRLVVCIGIALAGALFFDGPTRVGMFLIAASLVFDKAASLYYAIGSAMRRFDVLANANIISGVLTAVITIGVIKLIGVYSQLVATLTIGVVLTLFYRHQLKLQVRPFFERTQFVALLKNGFPFVGLSIAYYLWRTSDRTLIAALLGTKSLGTYAFATTCIQLVLVFMNDFQTAIQPAVYERTATAVGREDFFDIVRNPSIMLGYLTPILIAFLWVSYPLCVRFFMPEYLDSVWVFRLLTGQIYLINIEVMVVYLLKSPEINGQSLLIWSYGAATAISYALVTVLLKGGHGLVAVAAATVAAHLVAAIITFAVAQRHFLPSSVHALRYYGDLLTPLPWLVAFCAAVFWIESAEVGDVIRNLAPAALLLMLSATLLYSLSCKADVAASLYRALGFSARSSE